MANRYHCLEKFTTVLRDCLMVSSTATTAVPVARPPCLALIFPLPMSMQCEAVHKLDNALLAWEHRNTSCQWYKMPASHQDPRAHWKDTCEPVLSKIDAAEPYSTEDAYRARPDAVTTSRAQSAPLRFLRSQQRSPEHIPKMPEKPAEQIRMQRATLDPTDWHSPTIPNHVLCPWSLNTNMPFMHQAAYRETDTM